DRGSLSLRLCLTGPFAVERMVKRRAESLSTPRIKPYEYVTVRTVSSDDIVLQWTEIIRQRSVFFEWSTAMSSKVILFAAVAGLCVSSPAFAQSRSRGRVNTQAIQQLMQRQ